jgi:hypothetical protein
VGSVGSFASALSVGSSQSVGSLLSHGSTGTALAHRHDGPDGRAVLIGAVSVAAVAGHLWFWGRRSRRS